MSIRSRKKASSQKGRELNDGGISVFKGEADKAGSAKGRGNSQGKEAVFQGGVALVSVAEGCSREMLVKRPLDLGAQRTQISEAVVLVACDGEKLVHHDWLQSKYEVRGLVAKSAVMSWFLDYGKILGHSNHMKCEVLDWFLV